MYRSLCENDCRIVVIQRFRNDQKAHVVPVFVGGGCGSCYFVLSMLSYSASRKAF